MGIKVITSFSGSLYYTLGQLSLSSMLSEGGLRDKIIAYHENSMERAYPDKGREICEVDFLDGVLYKDAFLEDPGAKDIVAYPEFSKGKSYLNKNAPFFFRKIVAIRNALLNNPPGLYCWLDSDVYFKKPFDKQILDFVSNHDICYLNRERISTESGVIFFNTKNPRVIDFVNEWYDVTKSKRVFQLKSWADHDTFDVTRGKFTDLSYGLLRSGPGRSVWYDNYKELKRPYDNETGWKYLYHAKGTFRNANMRVRSLVSNGVLRGHLYVAFGPTYDMIGAHSCFLLRKVSNLPIHVVSNLLPKQRDSKWSEVGNVTFSYVPLVTEKNRVVKTSLIFYSPFDETLYTDCDSVILSPRFKEVFDMLKGKDVLLPVYHSSCTKDTLNRSQREGYLHALSKVQIPGFNNKESFTIYGGGVCAFKKTLAAYSFFVSQNNFWEKMGGGRDMPAISAAVVSTKGLCLGLLGSDYNKIQSKIIKSCHGKDKSPLPHFNAYHPKPDGTYQERIHATRRKGHFVRRFWTRIR